MEKIDLCFERAKECILKCISPYGLYASAGNNGYRAVWARDSMISMIGASLVNDNKFKDVFEKSILTLAKNQAKSGQIPNCVDNLDNNRVDFKTIDSTLWFLIGNKVFMERYGDYLYEELKKNIDLAFSWLACQELGENAMLCQLPTSDWQDAFPHKYGNAINTQALYHKALEMYWHSDKAIILRNNVNNNPDTCLWNKNNYYAYRWKNHGKYKEIGDWFDSFGNILAIVFDICDSDFSKKILDYIEKNKINKPMACRAIYPAIDRKSKYWQDYYLDCLAGKPNNYLNGGIWGYIGCYYVLALIKMKQYDKAYEELKKIAETNLKNNFPEWTHPMTGKSYGKLQAWEAGSYILAYKSLDEKRVRV